MGYIKFESIEGYYLSNETATERQMVCSGCVEREDLNGITRADVLTNLDMKKDGFYFCDRCRKRIA